MALTYTFQMPANFATRPVKVYNTAGVEQTSGTTNSNAVFTASLPVGDYFARVSYGYMSYEAAGSIAAVDVDRVAEDLAVYDTGWRYLEQAAPVNSIHLRRMGATVYAVSEDGIGYVEAGTNATSASVIPAGFRCALSNLLSVIPSGGYAVILANGGIRIDATTEDLDGVPLPMMSWPTDEAEPTVLPGIPSPF